MLISNSYNSLGRVGPHYERPEYRPPEQPPTEDKQSPAGQARGDRRTLSTRNTDTPAKPVPALPAGRATLENIQSLTSATADLIRELTPQTTGQNPHRTLPTSLMAPIYV